MYKIRRGGARKVVEIRLQTQALTRMNEDYGFNLISKRIDFTCKESALGHGLVNLKE